MEKLSTERFSDRVDNYVRYRPGYPKGVIDLLREGCGLHAEHVLADVASGTGIFTRVLLENGNQVIAIEPNAKMRGASGYLQQAFPQLKMMNGTAEQTELPDDSVDFITVAQAAHWFEPIKARREFERILKPRGWCVLIWNERASSGSAFLEEYEMLLQNYCPEYKDKRHGQTARIAREFFPEGYREHTFANDQQFDYEGLKGRLLSSSYCPLQGDQNYPPMMQELERMFRAHAENNQVQLKYETRVYFQQLG
jgi:ubiquinone/menaquinone biosynthesis C-methylase UbiE